MKTSINKIESYEYNGPVYNVEVEPNHPTKDDQFFIQSDTGIVVHNCHPRDNIALRYLAQELNLGYDLFDSIMTAREIQAENLAMFLVDIANERNMPIYIHGKAYKPKVSYVDGSYSLLVEHYCREFGHDVCFIDPMTGDKIEQCYGVILLAHSASTTYSYIGAVAEDQLYCKLIPGSVVVDPWRKFTSKEHTVLHYGNTREISKNL
jgi:UDPglucose 6-dehydrogenase